MNVSYTGPLQRAWARAQRMLFKPVDIRVWLTLGFAAFLSEAMITGKGLQASYQTDHGHGMGHFFHGGLLAGGLIAGIGMVLLAAAVILGVVLLWVNSRGRFVFLDGVVRERAAIVEPWKRFAQGGNSLFLWMLLFILACMAATVLMLLPFFATLAAMWSDGEFHWGLLGAVWVLAAVAVPFAIFVSYVMLFVSDFVVPIMYRDGLGAVAAWRRFLGLFRAHPWPFVIYGLFVFGLWLVVGVVVMAVGFSTCCIGFVLLGIPYVSHVLLLPLLVTFRGLGPEFLAQFGPDYSVLATAQPVGAGPSSATEAPAETGGAPAPPGAGG